MITSTKNEKLKEIRALQARSKVRREKAQFVIEGVRLLEEALKASLRPTLLLYSDTLSERGMALVHALEQDGITCLQAASHVMNSISDTKSSAGVLAVLPALMQPPIGRLDFLFVLDQVRDPGNMGTLLRTAAAAGAGAVFVLEGSVDPFAPKVLRSGMGAHFQLPVLQGSPADLGQLCRQHGLKIFSAEAAGLATIYNTDLKQALAIVVGSEAEGVSAEVQALQPVGLRIPMPGDTESLNAAIAGGILLFEVVRQRFQS